MNSGKQAARRAEKPEKNTTKQWVGTTATKQLKSSGKLLGLNSSDH